MQNGIVYCWGYNASGQLGDGTTTSPRLTPVKVADGIIPGGNTGITSIAAGAQSTCAIKNGSAYCWGLNSSYELGDGTSASPRLTPVAVSTGALVGGNTNITQITMGANHSCVLQNGIAYCWGDNGSGQLGDTSNTNRATPVRVSTGSIAGGNVGISQITAGQTNTCLLKSNASYCFGYGSNGQLGNGGTTSSNIPVATVESSTGLWPGNFVQVAPGYYYTCGLEQDGNIYCWGYNGNNQFGKGSTGDVYAPNYSYVTSTPATIVLGASYVMKSLTPGDYLDNVVSVDGSGYFVDYNNVARYAGICALQSTGKVRCWGAASNVIFGDGTTITSYIYRSFAFREVQDLANATDLKMSEGQYGGRTHACALVSDGGKVKCWGKNSDGQLGDGTGTDRYSPVTVSGIDGATAVYSGYANSCALIGNELRCWGVNNYGQLGNNSTSTSNTPATVQNLPDNFTIYNTATADKSMSAGNSVPTLCVTKNAYTANLGGLDGANSICQSDCGAGYKFAIQGDMGNFPASATPGGIYYGHAWIDGNPTSHCQNWTRNDVGGGGQTLIMGASAGLFNFATTSACSASLPVTCVKGVR